MKGPIYLDKTGNRLQGAEWLRLSKDDDYCNVRAFDNGVIRATVRWVGKVDEPNTFRDLYKLFQVRVLNYRENGGMVPDPVMDGKTYPDQESAVAAYEEFLETWTDSHKDEVKGFVEVGNTLIPPPPPDPDVPTSDVSQIRGWEDDGVGAW